MITTDPFFIKFIIFILYEFFMLIAFIFALVLFEPYTVEKFERFYNKHGFIKTLLTTHLITWVPFIFVLKL